MVVRSTALPPVPARGRRAAPRPAGGRFSSAESPEALHGGVGVGCLDAGRHPPAEEPPWINPSVTKMNARPVSAGRWRTSARSRCAAGLRRPGDAGGASRSTLEFGPGDDRGDTAVHDGFSVVVGAWRPRASTWEAATRAAVGKRTVADGLRQELPRTGVDQLPVSRRGRPGRRRPVAFPRRSVRPHADHPGNGTQHGRSPVIVPADQCFPDCHGRPPAWPEERWHPSYLT